jgi:ATP-binding cassette subfamily F protein uup
VKIGMNVEIASLDQDRAKLLPDSTLAEVLTDGRGDTVIVDGKQRHVISYMKDFLFTADQARQPVHVLSGGERARLLLAKLLARPSNLLVLDEPTNDLDLETLDLLQEMIADYPGTVLLVSHDRDFLDRTVTSIIMAEGDGRFTEYAGGYSDMVAQRGGGVAKKMRVEAPAQRMARQAAPSTTPAARRRMTFKDKHALEELPRRIADTEREIMALQEKLHDPGLYGRDPAGFATLSAKLAEAQKNLNAFEDRWIELEMLRAEIEGAA